MLDKLLSAASWLLSGSSIGLYVVIAAFGATSGWYLTQTYYEAQISEIKADLALQQQKEIQNYAARLSKATTDLIDANDRISALSDSNSDLSKRLLFQADREAKRTAANSGSSYKEEYAACRRLLSEGAGLLEEGCREFGKCAAAKDAVVQIVK